MHSGAASVLDFTIVKTGIYVRSYVLKLLQEIFLKVSFLKISLIS